MITSKNTFTNSNELISKSYVDTNFLAISIAQQDASYIPYSLYFTTSAILTATTGYFPAGSMVIIGSVSTAVNPTPTNAFTKIFKINTPTSSVGDGQISGYQGIISFPKIYIGSGFIWNMNFGIGDTNTALTSICQMFCGFTILTTAPVFSSTVSPNSSLNLIGVGCDLGDTVLSFYSRGASGGSVKTSTSFSCATPCTLWFNLTIYNPNNSNTMYLLLTEQASGVSASISYVCNTTTSILNSSLLYPVITRAMATAGGITGAAQCFVNKFQLFLK